MPSPLIRALLLREVALQLEGLPVPRIPVSFIMGGEAIDVAPLVKTAIQSIDATLLRRSIHDSFKLTALPKSSPNKRVPQEAVYQSELERIFRSWLPSSVPVVPQMNAGGRKRCDIVIVPDDRHRILLEIVASTPLSVIEEHFTYARSPLILLHTLIYNSRAREYGQYLAINDLWMLHFTIKEEDDAFPYPYPDAQ